MARSIGTRYPRGGSAQWSVPEQGAVVLDDAFFGTNAPAQVNGSLSATLGAATLSASATIGSAGGPVVGSLSQTLGAATASSTARLAIRGQLAGTLGAATSTATGRVLVRGTLAASLGDAILAATGEAVTPSGPVVGQLAATLGDAVLVAQGGSGEQPTAPIARGNYNSFGYYTPPPRKRAVEPEPEIVAEVIAAATEPVFRKPSPPKRVTPAMLPAAKPVDEQRVLAAMQAARREWMARDDDDAEAVALILAFA